MTQANIIVKEKLLAIHHTGLFINFPPQKIDEVYHELKLFLEVNSDTLALNDLYDLYEFHVYLSLITDHELEAKSYINRLSDQFDEQKSERIKLLMSLYLESEGNKEQAMEILVQDKNELTLSRRLTTFKRQEGGEAYINTLIKYLDLQPTDVLAWSELSEEYYKLGHYDKSIFCLKEILLQEPLNYLVFYRIGMLNYYLYLQNNNQALIKKDKLVELVNYLINARNNFLRTIEICQDHKESWLGVYLVSKIKFEEKFNKMNIKSLTDFNTDTTKILELAKAKVVDLNNISEAQLQEISSISL